MAKDPAFLFYSSDFLTGVSDLTMEERGQYITILCLQHQKGHLSEKTICLTVGSVSVDVLAKFRIDEKGFYYNERLELEIENRIRYSESRRLNGSKGGRPKTICKPYGKPTNNHTEDENVNENKDEEKGVLGGKTNPVHFPTMESHGNLQLTKTEADKALEINKGMTGQQVTNYHVLQWWSTFKLITFDGKTFKENEHDIKKHFFNWVKTQKIPVNGNSYNRSEKLGTSAARVEALKNWGVGNNIRPNDPQNNAEGWVEVIEPT